MGKYQCLHARPNSIANQTSIIMIYKLIFYILCWVDSWQFDASLRFKIAKRPLFIIYKIVVSVNIDAIFSFFAKDIFCNIIPSFFSILVIWVNESH